MLSIEKIVKAFEDLLDENIISILNNLLDNDFSAYIVGGAIRDFFLGNFPKGFDIITNAKPEDIMNLYRKHKRITVASKPGTVTVILDEKPYDISTLRKEKYEGDKDLPEITYVDTIEEDHWRRDFTVNAVYYDFGVKEFQDPSDSGVRDINERTLRMIGEPKERLTEDGMRILRLARLITSLNLEVHSSLLEGLKKVDTDARFISKKMKRNEIMLLMSAINPRKGLTILKDSGVYPFILQGVRSIIKSDIDDCKLALCWQLSESKPLIRLFAFFMAIMHEKDYVNAAKNLGLEESEIEIIEGLKAGKTGFKSALEKEQLDDWVQYVGKDLSKELFKVILLNAFCEDDEDIIDKRKEIEERINLNV